MGEVVLINKQKYYALPPLYITWQLCQAKLRHRIEICWRKWLKIWKSIFDSWLFKASLEYPIRFFVHFSKTLRFTDHQLSTVCSVVVWWVSVFMGITSIITQHSLLIVQVSESFCFRFKWLRMLLNLLRLGYYIGAPRSLLTHSLFLMSSTCIVHRSQPTIMYSGETGVTKQSVPDIRIKLIIWMWQ